MIMTLPVKRPRKRENISRSVLLKADLSSKAGVDISIREGERKMSWVVHEQTLVAGNGQR